MPKPVQELLQATDKLQRDFKRLLTGTEMVNSLLEFDNFFQRIKFRLTSMGAVTEPDIIKKEANEFPPITNFMGEDLTNGKQEILKDLIRPKEAEKQAFLYAVEKLYNELPTANPHSIINAYTLPEHILILRGVAKRAGVADYETRPMTVQFLEDIILGIGIKEEEKKLQGTVDDSIAKLKNLDDQPNIIILTKEDIDGDPELQKWKAAVGDQLIISKDGKRKLQKAK